MISLNFLTALCGPPSTVGNCNIYIKQYGLKFSCLFLSSIRKCDVKMGSTEFTQIVGILLFIRFCVVPFCVGHSLLYLFCKNRKKTRCDIVDFYF